jgi:hypothetical protein
VSRHARLVLMGSQDLPQTSILPLGLWSSWDLCVLQMTAASCFLAFLCDEMKGQRGQVTFLRPHSRDGSLSQPSISSPCWRPRGHTVTLGVDARWLSRSRHCCHCHHPWGRYDLNVSPPQHRAESHQKQTAQGQVSPVPVPLLAPSWTPQWPAGHHPDLGHVTLGAARN